jgi:hypothetical protein
MHHHILLGVLGPLSRVDDIGRPEPSSGQYPSPAALGISFDSRYVSLA